MENPIDKDQIAENPHNLPYASNRGSALVQPKDRGKIKSTALRAMYQQTDRQLAQIKEQIELLARQAADIHSRVEISEKIYQAEIGFEPGIAQTYYLYEKSDEQWVISLVGPNEWIKDCPFLYIATVQMLADHTWEILESASNR